MHIFVGGEYSLTADRDFVLSLGFCENQEITEEQFEALKASVGFRRAYNKACELLSMRDHSRKELITKLRQKGHAEYAEQAAQRLCEYGYIDDERFAEAYAEELRRVKRFGKCRIMQELFRKGIDGETAENAVGGLEFDEDSLLSLLERKYGRCLDTEKGVKRAVNGLLRMGYAYGEIKDALEQYAEENEDEYE